MWRQPETGLTLSQPRNAKHHRKPGEARTESPLESSEEHSPADTSIWGFWPPEEGGSKFLLLSAIYLVVISHSSPRETKTTPFDSRDQSRTFTHSVRKKTKSREGTDL